MQRLDNKLRITLLNESEAGYGTPLTAFEFDYSLVDTSERGVHTNIHTRTHIYIHTYILTYILTYLLTYLLTCIHKCI